MRFVVLAVCAAACGHPAAMLDARSQGGDDASADASSCLTSHLLGTCIPVTESSGITLDARTYDGSQCSTMLPQTGESPICVISGRDITLTLQSSARLRGPYPILLVASDTIRIDGDLSASSLDSTATGAGTPAGACVTTDGTAGMYGTGAAGGSFAGSGGNGGASSATGMAGASAAPTVSSVSSLRAGCAGGTGGKSTYYGIMPGAAGPGGGAVYLLAGNSILIGGTIEASGAPGLATPIGGGGSAGGSGGMIVLDAPLVMAAQAGWLVAEGGGGAAGGTNTGNGGAGQQPTNDGYRGQGGTPGTGGAAGGNGSAPLVGSDGAAAMFGGGGGGGGGGFILVYATTAMLGSHSAPPAMLTTW